MIKYFKITPITKLNPIRSEQNSSKIVFWVASNMISGDVSGEISKHNLDALAHQDIRNYVDAQINGLTTLIGGFSDV